MAGTDEVPGRVIPLVGTTEVGAGGGVGDHVGVGLLEDPCAGLFIGSAPTVFADALEDDFGWSSLGQFVDGSCFGPTGGGFVTPGEEQIRNGDYCESRSDDAVESIDDGPVEAASGRCVFVHVEPGDPKYVSVHDPAVSLGWRGRKAGYTDLVSP